MSQAFLTTFLIDSPYKISIQNTDELFDSGIILAYPSGYNFIFENGEETELSIVQRNPVICPSYEICDNWAKYQRSVSILVADKVAEGNYARRVYVGENSELLVCRLEDEVVFNTGLTIVMIHVDPLLRRFNEIMDSVVESGLYSYWIALGKDLLKLYPRKIAIVHPVSNTTCFLSSFDGLVSECSLISGTIVL